MVTTTEQLHRCQDCGQELREDQLKSIVDLYQRVAPGEPMPSGECACGALCQPIPPERTPEDLAYIEAARAEYGREGEIEIDDNAIVSSAKEDGGDDGAYVAAWVWVGNEEEVRA